MDMIVIITVCDYYHYRLLGYMINTNQLMHRQLTIDLGDLQMDVSTHKHIPCVYNCIICLSPSLSLPPSLSPLSLSVSISLRLSFSYISSQRLNYTMYLMLLRMKYH